MGAVEHIHIAPEAGVRVRAQHQVDAIAGVGLVGDRYAVAAGYWQDERVSRDLTLVEAEVIEDVCATGGLFLEPGELRRNITTRGIRLNELVGRTFWLGDALCRGTGLCEPCRHLEELTAKALLRPLVHRGGLRADVLASGTIRVGDLLEPAEELEGVGVVVVRESNVLLGRRLSRHGHATWSFPGGKPLRNESAEACAVRELHEETGLVGSSARMIAETLDGFPESRLVFRTRFVEVGTVAGQPFAREPAKTPSWDWYDWRLLPQPLFRPVASLVASGYKPTAP